MICRSTALGAALCAGAAINLFGWDLSKPESLAEVNTKGNTEFAPGAVDAERANKWKKWQNAVERSRGWEEGVDA
jgi:glycerol kinase